MANNNTDYNTLEGPISFLIRGIQPLFKPSDISYKTFITNFFDPNYRGNIFDDYKITDQNYLRTSEPINNDDDIIFFICVIPGIYVIAFEGEFPTKQLPEFIYKNDLTLSYQSVVRGINLLLVNYDFALINQPL